MRCGSGLDEVEPFLDAQHPVIQPIEAVGYDRILLFEHAEALLDLLHVVGRAVERRTNGAKMSENEVFCCEGHSSGTAVLVEGEYSVPVRSEEHTSELQSLMRISYAVFCLKKTNRHRTNHGDKI